jgi:hypothetical protein
LLGNVAISHVGTGRLLFDGPFAGSIYLDFFDQDPTWGAAIKKFPWGTGTSYP